jgi:RND family efflux transporter MFP subunit|nr:efflux RND transporter periplasmic adaptor subunit [Kofleriaceae bacterium]
MTARLGWPTMILLGAVGGVIAVGAVLYTSAQSRTNQVSLADSAKPVSTIAAIAAPFQSSRRYVGTIEPWVEAKIGPQLVSAYVDTVLVRPGAQVKRGEVIATLDCRNASAVNQQVAAQARAEDAMSTAAAKEAARLSQLLQGNYVSENEVDMKQADAASKQAQVAALKAQMANAALQVNDCVLRAPFDGEVGERDVDPGAFVRPGNAIATLIDRHVVYVAIDVPEDDFEVVAPGRPVKLHVLSTKTDLAAKISRRAPSADAQTRTAHVEIDVDNSTTPVPVWTTAEVSLDVGEPVPGSAIPLSAASVHGTKATVFVADNGVARSEVVKVIGEHGGTLYLDPKALPPGTKIVSEGRTVLSDKDPIAAHDEAWRLDGAVGSGSAAR